MKMNMFLTTNYINYTNCGYALKTHGVNRGLKNKSFCLLLSFCMVWLVSCDSGDIVPKSVEYSQEGRTAQLTGTITGLDGWSSKYTLRVASFNEDGDSPILSKVVTSDADGKVNMLLSHISDDATKVELCVLDRLRHRVFTLQEIDITNVSDTVHMDVGTLDASMFGLLQKKVFDERCISCHRNSENPSGQLNLTVGKSYASLVGKASYKYDDRILVKPYDGANSVLYQLMESNLEEWRMPHADIIKEENIRLYIRDWIDNGAKE